MRQFKINKNFTNRTEESLDKYLVEISRVPMITPEQEVELAQIIRKGGKKGDKAKEKLVTAHLRFVVSVAKQYQHQGVPLSDLINEGNIGLITAADKFDETRGFKFISYAIWWIRQSILQAIAEYSNMVRRPQSQLAISNKIKNATNEFLQKHQRYPSAEELSEIIELEIGKIEKAIQDDAHMSSIDAPISDDDTATIADSIASASEYASDRKVNYESMCTDVMLVLSSVLTERERSIVVQSFGLGCPERGLEDIGNDLGLSRERVRQIRERGLNKIRKSNMSYMLLRLRLTTQLAHRFKHGSKHLMHLLIILTRTLHPCLQFLHTVFQRCVNLLHSIILRHTSQMVNTGHILAILILELWVDTNNHLMTTCQILSHLQSRGDGIVSPWFQFLGLWWNPEQDDVTHPESERLPVHLISTTHKPLCLSRVQ